MSLKKQKHYWKFVTSLFFRLGLWYKSELSIIYFITLERQYYCPGNGFTLISLLYNVLINTFKNKKTRIHSFVPLLRPFKWNENFAISNLPNFLLGNLVDLSTFLHVGAPFIRIRCISAPPSFPSEFRCLTCIRRYRGNLSEVNGWHRHFAVA